VISHHEPSIRRRVIAIADSDSYLKWAAALMAGAPAGWDTDVIIVETAKLPSAAQREAALAGSGFDATQIAVVPLAGIAAAVASEHPDIVVVATIGPLADLVCEEILSTSTSTSTSGFARRPVVVSGLPGIALPARTKALVYRSQADLIVLHSTREVRVFAALAAANRLNHEFGLARLPFIAARGTSNNTRSSTTRGSNLIFAAQAIVPPFRHQRVHLVTQLAAFAAQNPGTRVVVKTRTTAGESQTHDEPISFAALVAEIAGSRVPNLVVSSGPMAEHLAEAGALVTVSSTAAIEAIALGVPVIVLDDFGVTPELINDVFIGSGLLGSLDDMLAHRFTAPTDEWLADNYFHDPETDSWHNVAEELVLKNRRGELAPRARHVRGKGGALRRAWDRKRVLGSLDSSIGGFVALIVGYPVRFAVLAIHEVHALVNRLAAAEIPINVPLEGETSQSAERDKRTHRAP